MDLNLCWWCCPHTDQTYDDPHRSCVRGKHGSSSMDVYTSKSKATICTWLSIHSLSDLISCFAAYIGWKPGGFITVHTFTWGQLQAFGLWLKISKVKTLTDSKLHNPGPSHFWDLLLIISYKNLLIFFILHLFSILHLCSDIHISS